MSKQRSNNSVVIRCILITIVLALISGGAMFALVKHRQQNMFEARRSVIISHDIKAVKDNENDQYDPSDLSMMPTYRKVAEDPMVAKAARHYLPHKLQKKYSADDISQLVDTHSSPQSLVLELSVTTGNKADSAKLVNAVAKGFKETLPDIQPGAGTVRLLAPATKKNTSNRAVSHTKKYVMVGLAFGALLGLIISFFYVTWLKLI